MSNENQYTLVAAAEVMAHAAAYVCVAIHAALNLSKALTAASSYDDQAGGVGYYYS